MKDYNKYAAKIRKMGTFSDIHQCGCPSENFQVNLCFQLCEAYIIGYTFYVAYSFGEWSIDYPDAEPVNMRSDMKTIRGIKTDKQMFIEVEKIINHIREYCGIKVEMK